MFKHYLLAGASILAGLIAYADASGLLATLPLPDKLAWLPVGVGIANVVIQQLRRAKVDKSTTNADDPY